jgi:outer membrane protein assembly factor BamB
MQVVWTIALLLVVSAAGPLYATDDPPAATEGNWPQFRGPGARGVAEDAAPPDTWSDSNYVAWLRDIPGRGWSSPVVWDGRAFLTTAVSAGSVEEARKGLYFGGDRAAPPDDEHVWLVLCLDLDSGEVLWEREVHRGVPQWPLHIKNSYASETPVTDGERVYAYFGNVGMFCFDLDGNPQWERRWPVYRTRLNWGTAASPVLHGNRLYVVNDNEEQSYLEALDKATGDTVWRVERAEKSNWATPFVWENEQRTEIITPGTGKTRAYDLEGNLLYEFGGSSSITIATPYTAHGLLYVSSGYILDERKPLWAIRPGASGDISLAADATSSDSIAWCGKMAAPYNPTTIVYGDLLYVLLDRGFLACYDARTGRVVYEPQRLGRGSAYTVSPWAYDGRIFCMSEYGETCVVRAGSEFEVLHTNSLATDDMCMATPAIAGNRLLIRTDSRLYCIAATAADAP